MAKEDGRYNREDSTIKMEPTHNQYDVGDRYDGDADELPDATTQFEDSSDIEASDADDDAKAEELASPRPPTEDTEDTAEEPAEESPSLCQYTASCNTGSRDYRKVISHIFGRNKKCTTQIPDSCWIVYCRKHYQRTRYRTNKDLVKQYFIIQFDNLRRQLTRMERWGGVISWTIGLRKKERDILNAEDRQIAQLRASGVSVDNEAVARIQRCGERFMLGYIGENKTWAEVRHVVDVIEREVKRLGMTELPGFELLPDIDSDEHPPVGARKAMHKAATPRSVVGSRRRAKTSMSTSRVRSSSGASKRRRLVQRTPRCEDSEESVVKSEDDERESPAETRDIAEPSSRGNFVIRGEKLDSKPAKKSSKTPRTTEDALGQGWYPKEDRLKAPPARSATPKTPKAKAGSLQKEASNRSAAKQHLQLGSDRLSSPPGSSGLSEARDEESVLSDTSRTTWQGYDPWPKSTLAKGNVRSFKPSTPVSSASSSRATAVSKQGMKRSASPATPSATSSSIVDHTKSSKKARISRSTSTKETSARHAAVSVSPDDVAYRPATPKTPPRGTRTSASLSTRLPELRKFPTPKAPRTANPQTSRITTIDRTPTPQISRTRSHHTDRMPTSQASRSLTSQQLPSSPTPLPRHSSPKTHGHASLVNKRLILNAPLKNEDDDEAEVL